MPTLVVNLVYAWVPPEDEHHLGMVLRIRGEWNEELFTCMVHAAEAVLTSRDPEVLWDPSTMYLLDDHVRMLEGFMTNSGYRRIPPTGMTQVECAAYLDLRIGIFEDLRHRYLAARSTVPKP